MEIDLLAVGLEVQLAFFFLEFLCVSEADG